MSFEFSAAQLAQINAAYGVASPTHIADTYALIHSFIDGQPGVDAAVTTWFQGAEKVNRGVGAFSDFIREYTRDQYFLRFGQTLTDSALQQASDSIGDRVITDILANHTAPSLERLGEFDAGAAAQQFFNGDPAGWSGNILFPALGDSTPYLTNILGHPGDTYNLLAAGEAAAQAGPHAFITTFTSFGNLASALSDLLGTIPTVFTGPAVLAPQVEDFLDAAYGGAFPNALTRPFTSFQVGSLTGETYFSGPGDQVINTGAGDDTIVGSAGTDLLDGGAGADAAEFVGSTKVTVNLNVDPNAIAKFVGSVSLAGGASNLFNIETIVGSSADDDFIVHDFVDGLSLDGQQGAGDSLSLFYLPGAAVVDQDGALTYAGRVLHFSNFERFEGTAFGDVVGFGTANAEIHLGAGDDTLKAAASGAEIWGDAGSDTFQIGGNIQIEDVEANDVLTDGAHVLHGGLHWTASANPYAWDPSHRYGFGLNHEGDLEIYDAVTKGITFVSGWVGGPGAPYNAGGLYVAAFDIGAYRLLDENWPKNETILGAWSLALGAMMKVYNGTSYWAGVDPLVLDLDGDGLELAPRSGKGVTFDLDGDGYAEPSGWVRPDDGFLVRDANHNGQVDAGELFGNPTQAGFAALAVYDTNHDGKIDTNDAAFADLRVWRDLDQDHQVDAGELQTLVQAGVTALGVTGTAASGSVATNQILATGSFTRTDGSTGVATDVAFTLDNQHSVFLGDHTISTAAAALPELKGYGTMPDLRVAMTLTPSLQSVLSAHLPDLDTLDLAALRAAALPIFTAWAQASPLIGAPPSTSRHDVPILLKTVNGQVTVSDFAYQQTAGSQPYWVLASGHAVHDANGVVIDHPTLAQVQADAALVGTWSTLDAATIGFMERYLGEAIPIDSAPADATGALSHMTDVMNGLWQQLDSMAVRLAMQGPLASFFPGLRYDVSVDGFQATTSQQLIPSFEAIFADAAAQGSGALARLHDWAQIVNVVVADYHQPDDLLNTTGFLFSNLVAAFEATVGLSAGVVDVAGALGLPSDLVRTGAGALTGGTDADLFFLSAGDQTASGGLGPDTYVVGGHFGHDVINDFEGATDAHAEDTLRFANIASTAVTAHREGLDLVIDVNGTSDELRIVNQFDGRIPGVDGGGDLSDDTGVDVIVFADGVSWTPYDIARAVSHPQAGSETLTGTDTVDWLDGGAGNDSLAGGDDGDVYAYGRGDGDDVVFDNPGNINLSDGDLVLFKPGVALEDVRFSRPVGTDDLVIRIVGETGALTIKNEFSKTYTGAFGDRWINQVEAFHFDDGLTLSWKDVIDRVLAASGSDGNDTIIGYSLPDDLAGGKGDDSLSGGNEDDVYRYALGDGHDVIDENVSNISGGMTDQVVFGAGVSPSAVIVHRIAGTNDAQFDFADGGSLVVKDQFTATATGVFGTVWMDRIESFAFQDAPGVVWTADDVMNKALAAAETNGADTINGFWRQDTLDGGAGNDRLAGGEESDTYVFGRGYGHDTIAEGVPNAFQSTDTDRIVLLSGVAPTDIVFERTGLSADFTLRISGTQDSVTILAQNDGYGWSQVEQVVFNDGTVWTAQFLRDEFLRRATSSGADTINGFAGADTLAGGTGNDLLNGGGGNDLYQWSRGDGADTITEGVDLGSADKLVLNGINSSDVTLSLIGEDVTLTITGTNGGSVRLVADLNEVIDQGVDQIQFADGTIWTRADLRSHLINYGGTSGADTINGSNSADIIAGGAGNDVLNGGNGDDTYLWSRGDGSDTITDGAFAGYGDKLTLSGVAAADVVLTRSGNDALLTIGGADGGMIKLIANLDEAYSQGVETIVLSDTTWTRNDLRLKLLAQASTSGADTIVGFNTNDTITGGAGNDSINGAGGDDAFVWGRGDGNDTITDGAFLGSGDKLVLNGASVADISLARNGDNLSLAIAGTGGGVVTVLTTLDGSYDQGVEQVVLTDATWTRNDLRLKLIAQSETAGADTVTGFLVNDTLAGGAGNDSLNGAGGDDTYSWSRGDGNDTIIDGAFLGSGDKLVLNGVNAADVALTRTGDNVTLTVGGTGGGAITVLTTLDGSYDQGVEQVVLSDAIWTRSDLRIKLLAQASTSGADTIVGFASNDTITGGAGADRLTGGAGADRFVYTALSDAPVGSSPEVITDFSSGSDKIDLSQIDANAGTAGDQAFVFVGTAAFSHVAGELRYDATPSGARTIFGDIDGDGVADFQIQVTGTSALTAADFML